MDLHVFPIQILPPTSLCTQSRTLFKLQLALRALVELLQTNLTSPTALQ